MPEDKVLKYRELKAILMRYGITEKMGKGSHRFFIHPNINGRRVKHTMSVHSEGQDVKSSREAILQLSRQVQGDLDSKKERLRQIQTDKKLLFRQDV